MNTLAAERKFLSATEVSPLNSVAVDPATLTYTPDAIEFGNDVVFLLSKANLAVFRWSISGQQYLDSISLTEAPQLMAYSAQHNRLYLSYASGRVGKVELGSGTAETNFSSVASPATSMIATGQYLFLNCSKAVDPAPNLLTYNAAGTLAASKREFYTTFNPVWSDSLHRMLFTGLPVSFWAFNSNEIDQQGNFGEFQSGSGGSSVPYGPFRVAPDGSRAVFRSADVFNAATLSRIGSLPVPPPPAHGATDFTFPPIVDSAWLGNTLHTVRGIYPFNSRTPTKGAIESWNDGLQTTGSVSVLGNPLRLTSVGTDGLLLVSLLDGRPIFIRFNGDLDQISSQPGNNPLPTGPVTRANLARTLNATTSPWVDYARHAGIVYFLFSSPAKIERYHVATGSWLAPISLPDGPQSLVVSDGGIYVGFGKSLSRFSLDGAWETLLHASTIDFRPLFDDGGRIYLTGPFDGDSRTRFGSVDLVSGLVTADRLYDERIGGLSFSEVQRKLIGLTVGIQSQQNMVAIPLNAAGLLENLREMPYSSYFTDSTRTFLFPDESRVVDDNGNIHSTTDLSYLADLGGAFADIDFIGESAVVLRGGNTLVGYSAALTSLTTRAIAPGQLRVAIGGGFVHSFAREEGRGVVATKTLAADLLPGDPSAEVDPATLTYAPDAIEFGGGVVYLLSKAHRSVFRWSISQQRYLSNLKLTAIPSNIAYSAAHQRLYLSHANGRVDRIDLATGTTAMFAQIGSTELSMVAAGELMFFASRQSPYSPLFTYDANGSVLGTASDGENVHLPVWNDALKCVYYRTFNSAISRSIDSAGLFGEPLTGAGATTMLRVSPNGSRLANDSGRIYNAANNSILGLLPVPEPVWAGPLGDPHPTIVDAAWFNGVLHTVRGVYPFAAYEADSGMIESWSDSLALTASGPSRGRPLRLNALSDGLLVVSMLDGRPVFAKYNSALEQTSSEPGTNAPPTGPVTRVNPSRLLDPTDSPWIGLVRHAGIAYLLFSSPAKIERYHLADGTWLEPISLPDGPTSFTVSASGIYVSFGKALSRFSLDGSTETLLAQAGSEIEPLQELDSLIYLKAASTTFGAVHFGCIDITTGTVTSDRIVNYSMTGISFSPARRKFFGEREASPADICQLTLSDDGTIGTQEDSPYHGDYAGGTRTYAFPDQVRVVDTSSNVYSAIDLTHQGRLGTAFTDLDFAGEQPVVLRNGGLVAYSTALDEVGRKAVPVGALRILSTNDMVISFAATTTRGVEATRTPLSAVVNSEPSPPIDPTNLGYLPDSIELANDGIVYLLSKLHRSVFRWSSVESKYLESISLTEVPDQMAYSPVLNRLYVSYPGGQITKIELETKKESHFTYLPDTALALQTAGGYLVAVKYDRHNGTTHSTFGANGLEIGAGSSIPVSPRYTWSETNHRLYSATSSLRSLEVALDGQFGQFNQIQLPFGSGNNSFVRVSPDGAILVLENAEVFDANSLTLIGGLCDLTAGGPAGPSAINDATWLNSEVFTITGAPNGGIIHRWNGTRRQIGSLPLTGEPLRLFAVGANLLAIVMENGCPQFVSIAPEGAFPPFTYEQCAGTFFASLVSETGSSAPFGGLVRLTLNAQGSASGYVRIEGKNIPFRLTFDEFGYATVDLLFQGQKVTLNLRLVMEPIGPRLDGSLSSAGWVLTLDGARAKTSADAGRFIFRLTHSSSPTDAAIPPFIGYGALTITKKAKVRITGSLLLGGSVTQGSTVLEDGSIVLALATRNKANSFAGRILAEDLPESDWSGTIRWLKREKTKSYHYPNPINSTVDFSGVGYVKGNSPLAVDPGATVSLICSGGGFAEPNVIYGIWAGNGTIISQSESRFHLAAVTPRTGFVRGRLRHRSNQNIIPYFGIVNRKRNEIQGGYLGFPDGGEVRVVAGSFSPN